MRAKSNIVYYFSLLNYGIGYRNIFDERGFLKLITDETGNTLWCLDQTNVMGQITSVTAGNGKTTVRGYDAYHFPQSVVTGSLQNNTYSFRKENGNLLSRTDNIFGLSESFLYDAADRLEKNTFNATELVTAYDVSGNITAKTDAGAGYLYNSPKPHAVTGISNATANIPALPQNMTYTSFDKVQNITEGSHTLNFAYGIDRQRRKTILKNGSEILKTKYFFGNYEKVITSAGTRELNTIPGFDGNYALIVKDNTGQKNIYYVYTDHLGNTNIVSDAASAPQERHNFDAWGRERNPQTWAYTSIPAFSITDRGYTGHEHLTQFGLINMNGRLYDPVLGRMLSPDPFVQAPGNSQNYNRYSYVLNNPMKYTDPSGYWWWSHFKGWVDENTEKIRQHHVEMSAFTIGITYSSLMGIDGIIGFTDGYFSQNGTVSPKYDNGTKEAVRRFDNLTKIIGGQFKTDRNLNWKQRTWQMVSRHTWESPQNGLGLGMALLGNTFGRVDKVDYYAGATTVSHRHQIGGAFTVGSYIQGGPDLRADPSEEYFQHEYGHYLQSRFAGPMYLGRYAIPSLRSTLKGGNWQHNHFEVEQDANLRAFDYWNETIDGYSDWDTRNPILSDSQEAYPYWYDYLFLEFSAFLFHKP